MKTIPILLAGLLIATPVGGRQACQKLDWPVGADTAHCTLRIDGRTVTDGDCRISGRASRSRVFDRRHELRHRGRRHHGRYPLDR